MYKYNIWQQKPSSRQSLIISNDGGAHYDKVAVFSNDESANQFVLWITGLMHESTITHAQWIGESDGYADGNPVYDEWFCSNCDYCVEDDEKPNWNYCPNCGAKMDGGERRC